VLLAERTSTQPLTLDLRAVIHIAERNPPAILAAARNADARLSELSAAQHAYLPSLALQGRADYVQSRQNSAGISTRGAGSLLHGELSANFNAFDAGRRSHDVESAEHAAEGARDHVLNLQLTAAASAAELYLRLLADERFRVVLTETMSERSSLLEAVQALVDRGLRPAVDVVRTQAEIDRARLDLAVQHERTASDRVALGTALGLGSTTELLVIQSPEAELSVDDDPTRAAARALAIDPALREARAQRSQALARQARAQSELYPQVDLLGVAAADRTDRVTGNTADLTGLNITVGALASWTVLDVSTWDRAAAAASDAASAAATLAQTVLERRLAVIQTAYDVRAARAQLTQAEALLAAFELTVQAERERYQLGEASLLEVLTALDNLHGARSSQISASFSHDIARIKLKLFVDGSRAFER
jgi:outer membrane protein TolC